MQHEDCHDPMSASDLFFSSASGVYYEYGPGLPGVIWQTFVRTHCECEDRALNSRVLALILDPRLPATKLQLRRGVILNKFLD